MEGLRRCHLRVFISRAKGDSWASRSLKGHREMQGRLPCTAPSCRSGACPSTGAHSSPACPPTCPARTFCVFARRLPRRRSGGDIAERSKCSEVQGQEAVHCTSLLAAAIAPPWLLIISLLVRPTSVHPHHYSSDMFTAAPPRRHLHGQHVYRLCRCERHDHSSLRCSSDAACVSS